MKHVNVVARTILLMGLFSSGIEANFGLHQFWACKCPPGFYASATSQVYAPGELCKDKNESFIVGPNDLGDDFTTPNPDTSGATTILEACSRCAQGCATCQGPEVDQCLECAVGYFAYQTQTDKSDVQSVKTKRSSETRADRKQHGSQGVNSRKIFEEDELLLMDVDVRKVRDATGDYHQNSQNYSEDALFKEYDDEESSGEIDDGSEALVVHLPELPDIPRAMVENPKPSSTLENHPADSADHLESRSDESKDVADEHNVESTLTNVEKNDSKQADSMDAQHSTQLPLGDKDMPAVTTEGNFKLTLPQLVVAQSMGKNSAGENKTIDQEKVSSEEQSVEDDAPNQVNIKAILNDLDKNFEPADEPEESHETSNISLNSADIFNENFNDEKPEIPEVPEIPEIAISTNPRDPLKNLSKVNPEVNIGMLSKTGSALIPTPTYSCLANCPEGHYNTSNRFCLICHAECEGCFNDGPTNCIKCRNYKKGSICVASCTSNETSTEKYNSNCEVQSEEETIPAGYYAIPPLVIVLVCLCVAVSYCRKRRKLKNSLSGRPEGMHKTDMHSSEISFTRTHLDNKKCFYKGSKPAIHIAQTEFKSSSETLKRKGNPYVYAERPLLPKYAHQTATNSPAWSACKDMSEPEYEFDPLYETPDNTMDLETLKRYHYRRRSSPSHVHFALTTSKVKEISNSLEDCLDTDSLCLDDQREYDDVDDLRTENYERKFVDNEGDQLGDLEAPYYQAPPLPVRNSPSVQDIIIDDHIYVNIDEDA